MAAPGCGLDGIRTQLIGPERGESDYFARHVANRGVRARVLTCSATISGPYVPDSVIGVTLLKFTNPL